MGGGGTFVEKERYRDGSRGGEEEGMTEAKVNAGGRAAMTHTPDV